MRPKMFQIEKQLIEELINHGYPENAIFQEWGDKGCIADVAIIPKGATLPAAFFEIKTSDNQIAIRNGVNRIKRLTMEYDVYIPCYLVFYNDDTKSFVYNTVTDQHIDGAESIEGIHIIKLEQVPSYQKIIRQLSAHISSHNEAQREKYVNSLKLFCWFIIPVVSLVVLILDEKGVYMITTERLLVLGFVAVVMLLPFFKKISIKDIGISIIGDEEAENNDE